jgi:hypothetical protein
LLFLHYGFIFAEDTAMQPKWLEWAKALQSITQTGLHYTDMFDAVRYRNSGNPAEIVATYAEVEPRHVRGCSSGLGVTPKIDVRGVVPRHAAVRESSAIPAGCCRAGDVNESPAKPPCAKSGGIRLRNAGGRCWRSTTAPGTITRRSVSPEAFSVRDRRRRPAASRPTAAASSAKMSYRTICRFPVSPARSFCASSSTTAILTGRRILIDRIRVKVKQTA